MAEEILVNGTNEILKKLGAVAAHEIGLMLGVRGELTKLQNTVDMIQKVLEDAEKRQGDEKAVRLWLQRLKQAAHDAEDILDEAAYETLRRKTENKVRNFLSLSNPLAIRLKMAHRVQGVNRILDDIAKEKNAFNLKEAQGSADQTSLDRDTSPFVDDTEVYGREDEKSHIIKMLLDDFTTNKEQNVSVIPIVGFGGLGKTTLAQLVYNDEEVSKCFSFKKWVCVANDSSDKTLLGEVFRVISESHLVQKTVQMQESLKEKLSGKKFLLVLDDVWNSDKWEDVRVILKCGAQGSKVIVTTRIEKVANEMGTVSSLHLGNLPEAHCRIVFEKRAFRMGGPKKTSDLEEIGWKIVEKCGGVPLAVKALGSLMHSKKTLNEWKVIQNSENINVVGDNIMDVLRLSYDHLSSPLKQCFQYCGIFPKDTKITKNDLIQQWMAQGFIRSSNDLEMEEVGNDYFKTLCWNSFFQNLEVDKNNEVISCKMHDIVHDLAQLIMGKEMLVFSHTTMTENINIRETRHLVIVFDDKKGSFAVPKNLYQAKKLRTIFSDGNEANDAWPKFKFLRVLHLEEIEKVPSSISKLKLLRYLCIESQSIEVLPQSICQLYYLETLNVEHCYRLKVLPRDIWKLNNLRHLYIGEDTKMPKRFGRLCHLRTISPILCLGEEKDGCGIGELEHLNNISGHLRINNMEKVRNVINAGKAKLREKEKIYHLQMLWSNEHVSDNIADGTRNNYSEVLQALNPPPNLKELSINGFQGVKLPLTTWLANGSLPYLVEIKLQNCRNLQEIPPIWHIQPSLEILEISSMDKVKVLGGKCTSTGTPVASRLKRISLTQMAELEEWVANATITSNSFPCLEELTVRECGMLRIAPFHFPALKQIILDGVGKELVGLMLSQPSSLISLERLSVENCPKLSLTLASFPSLKEIYVSKIYNLDMMCSSATNDRHHHLPSLTSLRVEHVPEFTAVSKGFLQSSSSEHLQSVIIDDCAKFQGFVDVEGELPLLFSSNLKQIKLDSCGNLECINVRGLTSLETLKMTYCKGLESSILGLQSLQALKYLELNNVPIIMLTGCDAINGGCCWPHLEILKISSSRNLALTVTQFPSLRFMQISSTDKVVMEPIITNDDILASLAELQFCAVNNFTSLPEGLLRSCSKSLKNLRIEHCSKFQGFTTQHELLLLTSLEELYIEYCSSLTSLELSSLVSLTKLIIMDCAGIKSFPFPSEDLQRLPSLRELLIGGFSEELDNLPFLAIEDSNSPWCSSLQHLTIKGWSNIKSLPHQLQHLTALTRLDIRQFDSLVVLPEWLGNLSSLQYLSIHDCRHLMHIPSKQQLHRLTLLNSVSIWNCPLLSIRLKSDDEERLKIPVNYKVSHDEAFMLGTITSISRVRDIRAGGR